MGYQECARSCARQDPCSLQGAIVEGYPPSIAANTIVLLQETLKARLVGRWPSLMEEGARVADLSLRSCRLSSTPPGHWRVILPSLHLPSRDEEVLSDPIMAVN